MSACIAWGGWQAIRLRIRRDVLGHVRLSERACARACACVGEGDGCGARMQSLAFLNVLDACVDTSLY